MKLKVNQLRISPLELTFFNSFSNSLNTHSLSITPYLSPPPPCFIHPVILRHPSPQPPHIAFDSASLGKLTCSGGRLALLGFEHTHTQRDPRPSLLLLTFCPGQALGVLGNDP